jgi:hypothetical protein
MYIIHCLVRNNTRIIPPGRTFVNGVLPEKQSFFQSLFISHCYRLSSSDKLVILTNVLRSGCQKSPIFLKIHTFIHDFYCIMFK